ncbi:hypothetical protein P9112_008409 [Eukaryota sp. TZLM1-RC]
MFFQPLSNKSGVHLLGKGNTFYGFNSTTWDVSALNHIISGSDVDSFFFTYHFPIVQCSGTEYTALLPPSHNDLSSSSPLHLPSLSSLQISSFVSTKHSIFALTDSTVYQIDLNSLETLEISLPCKTCQLDVLEEFLFLLSADQVFYCINLTNHEVILQEINDVESFAIGNDFLLLYRNNTLSVVPFQKIKCDFSESYIFSIASLNLCNTLSICNNIAACASNEQLFVFILDEKLKKLKSGTRNRTQDLWTVYTLAISKISNVFVTESEIFYLKQGKIYSSKFYSDNNFVLSFSLFIDLNKLESYCFTDGKLKEDFNSAIIQSISGSIFFSEELSRIYSEIGFVEYSIVFNSYSFHNRLSYLNRFRTSPSEPPSIVSDYEYFVMSSSNEETQKFYLDDNHDVSQIFATESFPIIKTFNDEYFVWRFNIPKTAEISQLVPIIGISGLIVSHFSLGKVSFALSSNGEIYFTLPGANIFHTVEEEFGVLEFVPFPTLVNIRQISACDELAAFVTFDGYVWLWNMEEDEPIKHKNLRHVSQISISSSQGLVVLNDGTLLGWSSDEECGFMPSGVGKIPMETPVIIDVPPIEYVAVSGDHAICLTKEGTVYTFGSNNYGKCGVNSDDDVITPTLLPFEGVDHVAIGEDNSYFIKDDVIYACGKCNGIFTKTLPLHQFKPTISLLTGVKSRPLAKPLTDWSVEDNSLVLKNAMQNLGRIAQYGDRLVYVNNEGIVIGTGSNHSYQLGLGHSDEATEFVQIPNLSYIQSVSMGNNFTLYQTFEGNLLASGFLDHLPGHVSSDIAQECSFLHQFSNVTSHVFFSGGLGILTMGIVYIYRNSGKRKLINDVVQITTDGTDLWILKSNGFVYKFGGKLKRIGGIRKAVVLAVSPSLGLALLFNGSVLSWGGNYRSALGFESEDEDVAEDVESDMEEGAEESGFSSGGYFFKIIPNLPKVKAIAAGDTSSIFVTEEGKVLVIGDNDKGQIGLGEVEKAEVLTEIPNIENVSGVKAFEDSAVLVSNGELYISGKLGKFFFGEPCTTFTKIPEVKYTPCLDYSKTPVSDAVGQSVSSNDTSLDTDLDTSTNNKLSTAVAIDEKPSDSPKELAAENTVELSSASENIENVSPTMDQQKKTVDIRKPNSKNVETPIQKPTNSTIIKDHDPEFVEYEGFLVKQGKKVKNWKRRWFTLSQCCLRYYANRTDKKPKNVLILRPESSVDTLSLELYNKLQFSAQISHYLVLRIDKSGRDFYLLADSVEDRNAWLEALQMAVPFS